jgi:DNA-binding winged helix-turn-helix (wHTH) protein/serine/threonine protein kinase
MAFSALPIDSGEGVGRVRSFAGREFNESHLQLRVHGQPVELELKPLEVLIQLLNHPGEVLTKEQLLAAVWPGLNVVEGSLTTAVHKLRKALGDNDATIVVTVPRVGYRLAAEVHEIVNQHTPAVARTNLSAGDSVPGRESWRLVRPFDRSGSAEVWLAENPQTHEFRVFKFAWDTARAKALRREVAVFRFLRETLGHRPDFVRVFEWNFDTQPYFLESEYGGPYLAEWADRQGGLGNIPLDRRLRLLAGIADAVAAAHGTGVLHKDLKPANALVTATADGEEQIKLADFGSASVLEPSRLRALGITAGSLTQTTVPNSAFVTGTLMYIAPEVLTGNAPAAVADVYALGVMLYQLVIGDFRKPLAPGWERGIGDLLIREDVAAAACGDPDERLGSAAEFADRLRSLEVRRTHRNRVEEERLREEAAAQKRAQAHLHRPWIAVACIAGVLSTATLLLQRRRASPGPALKSVAVLPFQNLGSDRSFDFLSQAIPDEVATSLSYARSLSVRPFAVTSKYTQPDLDLQKAAKELKAAAVVTGHFMKAGDDLEVALEAIDAKTGHVFWRDTVTVASRSMITLREKLLARTRGTLAAALGASAFTIDAATRPVNEEAYSLYLRAAAIPMDTTRSEKAIAMLERSVGLDSTFAPSWLMLSRNYYAEGRYGRGGKAMMEQFEAAVARSVALDPNYIAAAANLVIIDLEKGDLIKALHEAEDLLRRRPDSADAHHLLGGVLRYAGVLDESAAECETTLKLDPGTRTSGLRSCSILFALSGNYRRAMDYLNLDPTSDFYRAILLTTLLRQGRAREAAQLGPPRIPQWQSYDMLSACAQNRPPSEIDAVASTVEESGDPEANYLAAANLAYCGQSGAALRLLKVAIQGNYCSYPAMDSDPFFARVRTIPEFAALREAGISCRQRFVASRSATGQAH